MAGNPLEGAGSLAGGILGGIASIGNMVNNANMNKWQQAFSEKNFNFQQDQFEYTKELQAKLMEREDNAIQRRIADLEASGMNPLSAIAGSGGGIGGGGASAGVVNPKGSPVSNPNLTPFTENPAQMFVDNMYNIRKMYNDIGRTQADINLQNEQAQTEKTQQTKNLAEAAKATSDKKTQDELRDSIRRLNETQAELNVMKGQGIQSQIDLNAEYMKTQEWQRAEMAARTELMGLQGKLTEAQIKEIKHRIISRYLSNSAEMIRAFGVWFDALAGGGFLGKAAKIGF